MKINKKYTVIGLVMIVVASVTAYLLQSVEDDPMTKIDTVMSAVPAQCYAYFPAGSDKSNTSNGQVAYYQSVVDAINKTTGIKYIGAFLRSPIFAEWLFYNCPVYNGTSSIYTIKQFNASDAATQERIAPSPELIQAVKNEHNILDYNYAQNNLNFSRIEYITMHFNQTLQSTVDNLFLSGALNMSNTHQCINPSWRANSDIRQCSFYNSTFVVNLHNQDLMAIMDKPIEGLNVH